MPTIITRGAGSAGGFGFGSIIVAPPSQQAYTTAGTYTWVAPAGVTSVSVVCVGGGGSCGLGGSNGVGGGGELRYKNNIPITPGSSYTVVVGIAGNFSNGGQSSFNTTTVIANGGIASIVGNPAAGGSGGTGDGGGNGGSVGTYTTIAGGGGAGGYSGTGGAGGRPANTAGGSGAGGGGGGGGAPSSGNGGGGGGVGILGAGSNGLGGIAFNGGGGGGGSGGSNGINGNIGGNGGAYGGGGGNGITRSGGVGAVRIIWPGTTRQFPSTGTGDL